MTSNYYILILKPLIKKLLTYSNQFFLNIQNYLTIKQHENGNCCNINYAINIKLLKIKINNFKIKLNI